ncbi:unnamed protein product [Rhizoctonia solani]|uniref:AMP-dependent synthetase/ligase domain-containing protein n=1 Tax=Rhizoctonia solani TaxID=456999 RepID=A0A8H3AE64_9AGAM|nr:unnamed protein product [Rhizoctonia solani]
MSVVKYTDVYLSFFESVNTPYPPRNMSPDSATPSPRLYPGPNDEDPLTEDELALLLAVPRAAESTPNATLFRFPLGPDPSMRWIDATCAETYSIVSRLADTWKSKLSGLLNESNGLASGSVGPGTTICMAIKPDFHGIFHLIALWAIGCTVQFVSMADPSVAIDQLHETGCNVILCSGFDDDWIEARKNQFDGIILQLPEQEQAHELVKSEKQGQLKVTTPPWPVPQRPTPIVILQSSGSTGRPKLLRQSLYYYTIRHKDNCQAYLGTAHSGRTSKTPYTHPRLVPIPFYWSSTPYYIFTHLTTATPMAFAYFTNILKFPPSQLLDWAVALDVGAISCSSGLVRSIPRASFECHAEFLRTLYSFSFTGSSMDNNLSKLFEELKIPIVNLYGSSELGRIFQASRPPYTHLRPFRGAALPLVHPISEYGADGSRYIELWYTPDVSPRLVHHLAFGGVPIKLEPFPGDGPHKGELAVNLEDIFQELPIRDASGSVVETVYIHVGRHSDQVRLGAGGVGSVDAALYEATFGSEINARLGRSDSCPWTLDGVQLFGNNMSCTSLVVQLCRNQASPQPQGSISSNDFPTHDLFESIEKTNDWLELTGRRRVHTTKRTLILSSDGTFVHGPGSERLAGSRVSLSLTHKRTPKRWENVCKFKAWLEGLDFSEP